MRTRHNRMPLFYKLVFAIGVLLIAFAIVMADAKAAEIGETATIPTKLTTLPQGKSMRYLATVDFGGAPNIRAYHLLMLNVRACKRHCILIKGVSVQTHDYDRQSWSLPLWVSRHELHYWRSRGYSIKPIAIAKMRISSVIPNPPKAPPAPVVGVTPTQSADPVPTNPAPVIVDTCPATQSNCFAPPKNDTPPLDSPSGAPVVCIAVVGQICPPLPSDAITITRLATT